MPEQKIQEQSKEIKFKLFWTLKNYIYLLMWIAYFSYYFSWNYGLLVNSIKENILYWEIILEYINAFFAFFTVVWLIWALNRLLYKVLWQIADSTNNDIDNIMANYLFKIIKTSKYFIALFIFFKFVTTPDNISNLTDKSFYIIFLIIFIYYLTSFLNLTFEKILAKRTRFRSLNKNLLTFTKKVIIIWVWIIWIITVLSNLGYNVTALITWAWIWGLAIALAAQKTLSNVFGAITVLLTKPFKIWDFVRIGWQVWTVKEMWLSHLTMVDKEWYYVLIPNEKLISNNIENLTKRETRRTQFMIWLEYGTTLLKMKKAVEIIEKILEKYVESETIDWFRVHFDNFWDFSLNIETTYYSLLNEEYLKYVKQKEEINLEIKKEFEKSKISMAFPTQEVIIKK